MEKREAFYRKLNKYLLAAYIIVNVFMGILDVYRGDTFHYTLAFGSLLFIPAVGLFYKLVRIKPVHQLNTIIFGFIFMAYTLGEVMAGYYCIPHFDKICHCLSGTFTGALGIMVYYLLKAERRVERSDFAMSTAFMFCFSMAIAAIWEICEFSISIICGTDPQWVKGTGVGDTMTDIIVCAIGTLLLVPSLVRFYKKGHADFLMGAVESFCELNLGGISELEEKR